VLLYAKVDRHIRILMQWLIIAKLLAFMNNFLFVVGCSARQCISLFSKMRTKPLMLNIAIFSVEAVERKSLRTLCPNTKTFFVITRF
jgi:hypothetical protein